MGYVILFKKSGKKQKVLVRKTSTVPYSWKKYDADGYKYFDTVTSWDEAQEVMRALKRQQVKPDTLRPLKGCWKYLGQPQAATTSVRWSCAKDASDFVYGLYKNSELIYIGVSNNPKIRAKQHRKSGKTFDYLEVISAHYSRAEADAFEVFAINSIQPPLNRLLLPDNSGFCFTLKDLAGFTA